MHAENAHKNFSRGQVGDHIALMNVFDSWSESGFSTQWCYENFVQLRSMKRARDIRDQLIGLMDRVEIEVRAAKGADNTRGFCRHWYFCLLLLANCTVCWVSQAAPIPTLVRCQG